MDKSINIRIIRNDGNVFEIGTGKDWQLLSNGKGLSGFGEFTNSINYVDNATMDGGIITSSRIGSVDRTIKCACVRLNQNDTQRMNVLNFFKAKAVYKVYCTFAGQTRWAEGYLYKFALSHNNMGELQTLTMTFTFANPYWKSFDNFGKDIASVTGMIAFPYMVKKTPNPNLTGGVFNFASIVLLNNDGDVETYCRAVFTAKGEVTNPSLHIGDAYVKVIDTMNQGDELVMDFTVAPPTIKKNGVNWIGRCDRTSSFDEMILQVGDTVISYDADNGNNLLNVSLYYNKLYGAI